MQVERGSKCNYQVIYMCFTCVSKRERKRKLSNHNFVNKLLTRILYIWSRGDNVFRQRPPLPPLSPPTKKRKKYANVGIDYLKFSTVCLWGNNINFLLYRYSLKICKLRVCVRSFSKQNETTLCLGFANASSSLCLFVCMSFRCPLSVLCGGRGGGGGGGRGRQGGLKFILAFHWTCKCP